MSLFWIDWVRRLAKVAGWLQDCERYVVALKWFSELPEHA